MQNVNERIFAYFLIVVKKLCKKIFLKVKLKKIHLFGIFFVNCEVVCKNLVVFGVLGGICLSLMATL